MSRDQLLVLGCQPGAPTAYGAASGYLLQIGGVRIVIDCGPGIAFELARRGLLDTIDAVIITHRHADHCADLLALAYQRRFPQVRAPLPLYGPPDLQGILDGFDALFGIPSLPALAAPLRDAFRFTVVVPGSTFCAAGVDFGTLATRHPVPTLALRCPRAGLVFTADSALFPALVAFAGGARVLLAEATYTEAAAHDLAGHGHLTASQAGELARDSGAAQLVLTHLAEPQTREACIAHAAAVFAGPIQLAAPGLVVALTDGSRVS